MKTYLKPALISAAVFSLLLHAPTTAKAACVEPSATITVVTELGQDSLLTWQCGESRADFEFLAEGVCDLYSRESDLPYCPIISGSELAAELGSFDGLDLYLPSASCQFMLDCGRVRAEAEIDWGGLGETCSQSRVDKVLSLDGISELLQAGDVAVTVPNCGEPSIIFSALLSAADPGRMKAMKGYVQGSGDFLGHRLDWSEAGEPCCDASDPTCCSTNDMFLRSALEFEVDGGAETWLATPGAAHVFPESGLALRFFEYVKPRDDIWVEDFMFKLACEVYAWAPSGFAEVESRDDWCKASCGSEDPVVEDDFMDVLTAPDIGGEMDLSEAPQPAEEVLELSLDTAPEAAEADASPGTDEASPAKSADGCSSTSRPGSPLGLLVLLAAMVLLGQGVRRRGRV